MVYRYNYLRVSEVFLNNGVEGFKWINSYRSNFLEYNRSPLSLNFVQLLEIVLYVNLKLIVGFWVEIFSILPYTVFKVKSGGVFSGTLCDSASVTPNTIYLSLKQINRSLVVMTKVNGYSWLFGFMDFQNYSFKKTIFFKKSTLFSGYLFKISDYVYLRIYSNFFTKIYKNSKYLRYETFISQTKWSFYRKEGYTSYNVKNFFNFYLIGLKFIWVGVRYWLLGLLFLALSFFFLIQLKGLVFNKTVFGYFIVGMFFYWLISGFVFFIKKYQYSKFTSVIQRF